MAWLIIDYPQFEELRKDMGVLKDLATAALAAQQENASSQQRLADAIASEKAEIDAKLSYLQGTINNLTDRVQSLTDMMADGTDPVVIDALKQILDNAKLSQSQAESLATKVGEIFVESPPAPIPETVAASPLASIPEPVAA